MMLSKPANHKVTAQRAGHRILAAGALFGLLSVVFGAFGAHILKNILDAYATAIFETAVRYQLAHALVLVMLGFASLARLLAKRWLGYAALAFVCGIVIFSGSLYLLAFTGIRWLGAITPIGGTFLIIGWVCLLIAALRPTEQPVDKDSL